MHVDLHNLAVYIRYSVYRKCPATGWEIGTRTIPDHEFVLITQGKGIITIEDNKHEGRAGTLFYFYPGLPHSLISCNENPMHFLAVHFSFTNVQYENNNWFLNNSINNTILPIPSVLEIRNYVKLKEILVEIDKYWRSKTIGKELMCKGFFLQLLSNILQDLELNCYNYSARNKVDEIISHIHKNLDKDLDTKMLADTVSLSPGYMCKIFKEVTGYSLKKYINRCRVDAAKKMLAEEGLKVKDVAKRLGFKDEFYFSKVFKNIEGISPKDFKRNAM